MDSFAGDDQHVGRLYGLVNRLRDFGAELVSVNTVAGPDDAG
jgi:hypothetical protein